MVNKGEYVENIDIIFRTVLLTWLLLCSLQDIKDKQINLILISLGFILLFIISIIIGDLSLWQRIAGLTLGIILLILSKVSEGQIGLGDGLIFCIIGLSSGFYINSLILIYSLLLAAVFSIIYMIFKKVNKKTTIPFIPFIFVVTLGVCLIE